MKTQKVKIHTGCGGVVEDGICNKCGKRAENFITRFLKEPLVISSEGKFDEKAYKERIREGKDL